MFKIPVALTYDNESGIDGFGAQALRIAGIYSIAKAFRFHYIHNPIIDLPMEELSQHPISRENYLDQVLFLNEIVNFSSSIQSHSYRKKEIIRIRSIWPKLLVRNVLAFLKKGDCGNIEILQPQGITDRYPKLLEFAGKDIRKNVEAMQLFNPTNSVVVHIRAEHHGPNKRRPHLRQEYYAEALVMPKVQKALNTGAKLVIHTDFFEEDFTKKYVEWRPNLFGSWFKEIQKSYSDVEILHYAPLNRVLTDMFNSRVLIMSRSSISYFAGIVNPKTVVWNPDHGHARLPRWLRGPSLPGGNCFVGIEEDS